MKLLKPLIVLITISLLTTGCFKDSDDNLVSANEINDFVWKGMNIFYLYKDNIPNLADDRFSSDQEYVSFLNDYSSPKDLFESLIYDRKNVDRFSWIVDNYFELEQLFSGVSTSNGMEFQLFLQPNSDTNLVGIVYLVLPNSDADNKGIKRGDMFSTIDGTPLTTSNYSSLLSTDSYTINMASYNDNGTTDTADDSIISEIGSTPLNKYEYRENPIYKNKIFNVGGENVGYLMYNGFIRGSENELNAVFETFKSNNIQHLIIDLRYNPGGSVSTTTFLASMITGQFNGSIFEKLVYNSNLQSENISYNFTNKLENGTTINSLNLNKIYVLTTKKTASASEGLINGLNPYIDVVQIGTNTTGKTQASITLYDSSTFRRENVNPNHTYAMQPLVAIGTNKNEVRVPSTGLNPSVGFEYEERPLNYGIIGDTNEPLLAIALADIENSTSKITTIKSKTKPSLNLLKDSKDFSPNKGGMHIDW